MHEPDLEIRLRWSSPSFPLVHADGFRASNHSLEGPGAEPDQQGAIGSYSVKLVLFLGFYKTGLLRATGITTPYWPKDG